MIIYKTTNTVNGKIYIGQTSKENDKYLGSGPIILKAVKKYGCSNFIRETLEICDVKEELDNREIYWIKFYNSTDREIGYNISIGGTGGNLGELVIMKLSTIAKESGRMLGNKLRQGKEPYNKGVSMPQAQKDKLKRPKSTEHRKNLSVAASKRGKKIICANTDTIYNSIKEAASLLNLTEPNIVNVLKGKTKATKGFIFQYI